MIYFILDRQGKAVKVGYSKSKETLRRRLSTLQVGNPRPLELLFHVEGGREGEKFLHRLLRTSRLCGEWFECTPEVVKILMKIKNGADEFDRDNDLIA